MAKYMIGVTGGIACGKSTVSKIIAESGGMFHIDADEVAHDVLKDPIVIEEIVKTFGSGVLTPESAIDRKALGKIVFADPDAMKRLETIEYGRIIALIRTQIAAVDSAVVLEAINLFKSGLADFCDSLWFVKASPEKQIARLVQSRGMSAEDAKARVDAQRAVNDWDFSRVNVFIDADQPLYQMTKQVVTELKTLDIFFKNV